ncbi:MAG: aminotransferase class V-fold PLP-dependent enzyme, partial [Bacteroidota bacterium]
YDLSSMAHPIHFMAGSGHKFHGPKGVGFLYINNEVSINPYMDGGAQERNMRAGTENIYGIVGMAKALELAYSEMEDIRRHIESIRQYMIDQLKEEIGDVRFNGAPSPDCHYKVLSVTFPPSARAALLLQSLDIAGISASGGSACSSGADVGSHVLNALKVDPMRKTIRFSFCHNNTHEEVDRLIQALKGIYKKEMVA